MDLGTWRKFMPDDNLDRAIALSRSGKKAEARELLKAILRSDSHNEMAWLWFADTFPDTHNCIAVLEECLKHNPDSQAAQKGLATFKSKEAKTITPIQAQNTGSQTSQTEQPQQPILRPLPPQNLSQKPITKIRTKSNNPFIFLASAFGIIILLGMCLISLWILQSQGIIVIPGIENLISLNPTQTNTLVPTYTFTPTYTQTQTITSTPTFTSTSTNTSTITPSETPVDTATPEPTPTPSPTNTQTQRPTIPIQNTLRPTPTIIISTPTNQQPTAIPTKQRTPTKQPASSVSCGVSPSVVPGASTTIITFYANFSPPKSGLGFSVDAFNPKYSGQRGCSASDGNNDGYASCDGRSGMLPFGKTITVTFSTSVGKCYATYSSQ
jgi:hypothetical protein